VINFSQIETFAVTECGGADLVDFTVAAITIAFPAVIFACLWRIFITDKSPRVIGLGLKGEASAFEPLATKQIASSQLFLYFLTSLSTFVLGVFAFKVSNLIHELIIGLAAQ
jgi:hypothetical protein